MQRSLESVSIIYISIVITTTIYISTKPYTTPLQSLLP
jgi:hypothetical protein